MSVSSSKWSNSTTLRNYRRFIAVFIATFCIYRLFYNIRGDKNFPCQINTTTIGWVDTNYDLSN